MIPSKFLLNIPFAVIIASFIIILTTTTMTDTNGLSALLGGYSGVTLGTLFTILIIVSNRFTLDVVPLLLVLVIAVLMIAYLSIYFDNISKGQVSGYYSTFSILSTVFMVVQILIIFRAIYSQQQFISGGIFTPTTFAFLILVAIINILIVLTLGITLKFYATQG